MALNKGTRSINWYEINWNLRGFLSWVDEVSFGSIWQKFAIFHCYPVTVCIKKTRCSINADFQWDCTWNLPKNLSISFKTIFRWFTHKYIFSFETFLLFENNSWNVVRIYSQVDTFIVYYYLTMKVYQGCDPLIFIPPAIINWFSIHNLQFLGPFLWAATFSEREPKQLLFESHWNFMDVSRNIPTF